MSQYASFYTCRAVACSPLIPQYFFNDCISCTSTWTSALIFPLSPLMSTFITALRALVASLTRRLAMVLPAPTMMRSWRLFRAAREDVSCSTFSLILRFYRKRSENYPPLQVPHADGPRLSVYPTPGVFKDDIRYVHCVSIPLP